MALVSSSLETLQQLKDRAKRSKEILQDQAIERQSLRTELEAKLEHALEELALQTEATRTWKAHCEREQTERDAYEQQMIELQESQEERLEQIRIEVSEHKSQAQDWKRKFEILENEFNEKRQDDDSLPPNQEALEWKEKYEQAKDRMEALVSENEVFREQMSEGQSRLESLLLAMDEKDTELKQSREARDELEAEYNSKTVELQSLMEKTDELQTQVENNESNVEELERLVEEKERDLEIVKEQLRESIDSASDSALEELEELRAQNDQLRQEVVERESTIEELEDELQSEQDEKQKLKDELELLNEDYRATTDDLDALEKDYEDLQNELSDRKSESSQLEQQQTEIKELKENMKNTKAKYTTAETKMKALIEENEELQVELAETKSDYEDLESKLRADVEVEIEELEEKLHHAQRDWKESKTTVDALRREIKDLQNKLDQVHSERDELKAEANSLSQSSSELQEKYTMAKSKFKILKDKFEEIQVELGKCKSQQQESDASLQLHHRKELEELNNALSKLKEENQELQLARAAETDLRDQITHWKEQATKSDERAQELQGEYQAKAQALDAKAKEVAAVKERAVNRLRQISILERKLGETTKGNKALSAEIAKLEEASVAVASIQQETDKWMTRYNHLEKQHQEEKAKFESERGALREKVSELRKDHTKISEENNQLVSQVNELKSRLMILEGSSNDGTKWLEKCKVLQTELQTIQDEYEETKTKYQQAVDRCTKFERESEKLIRQNEQLASELARNEHLTLEPASRDVERRNAEDSFDSQDLHHRCTELEKELIATLEEKNKLSDDVVHLKSKIVDLESYADDTAFELEQAENMISTLKASESENTKVTSLLEQYSKLQNHFNESQTTNEKLTKELEESKQEQEALKKELEASKESNTDAPDPTEVDDAIAEKSSEEDELTKDMEILSAKLQDALTSKDEVEEQLTEANEEIERQIRLKGHLEKDRDYLDKMYNECKQEMANLEANLISTKESLWNANDEVENLKRQLETEKTVSGDESGLEGMYRQAREELHDMEFQLSEMKKELEATKAKNEELEKGGQQSGKGNSLFAAEILSTDNVIETLQELSREELLEKTQKALQDLKETQAKLEDLQETNAILQEQLKSSLDFKEKTKPGGRGFWGRRRGNEG